LGWGVGFFLRLFLDVLFGFALVVVSLGLAGGGGLLF
jgi:hypothetical protein